AQALLFEGKPKAALELVAADDPSNTFPEGRARLRIVKADALCRLGESAAAELILKEADVLISQDQPVVKAEFLVTRARCSSDRVRALDYYSSALALAHDNDEFVEGTCLLNLGFLLMGQR